MSSRLSFLWSVDHQQSKTALFATIFTTMVLVMYPFAWWYGKEFPGITPELIAILWGTYIGSNKVEKWVKARNSKTTPPPEDEIPKP